MQHLVALCDQKLQTLRLLVSPGAFHTPAVTGAAELSAAAPAAAASAAHAAGATAAPALTTTSSSGGTDDGTTDSTAAASSARATATSRRSARSASRYTVVPPLPESTLSAEEKAAFDKEVASLHAAAKSNILDAQNMSIAFGSLAEAEAACKKYGSAMGYPMIKGSTWTSGGCNMRCHCYGTTSGTGVGQRQRSSKKTGCVFTLQIHKEELLIDGEAANAYYVCSSETEKYWHNHKPLKPIEASYVAVNRELTTEMKALIKDATQQGLDAKEIIERMRQQFPSPPLSLEAGAAASGAAAAPQVPTWIPQDVRNFITGLLATQNDVGAFLELCEQEKQKHEDFAYVTSADAKGRFDRCAFALSSWRRLGQRFSDVATFDTTFKISNYDLKLSMLIVVDEELRSHCVFAALHRGEDTATYIWVFDTAEKFLRGQIKCLFTDQALAIEAAWKATWGRTQANRHLLCTWHLAERLEKNVRAQLGELADDFKDAFYRLATECHGDMQTAWGDMCELVMTCVLRSAEAQDADDGKDVAADVVMAEGCARDDQGLTLPPPPPTMQARIDMLRGTSRPRRPAEALYLYLERLFHVKHNSQRGETENKHVKAKLINRRGTLVSLFGALKDLSNFRFEMAAIGELQRSLASAKPKVSHVETAITTSPKLSQAMKAVALEQFRLANNVAATRLPAREHERYESHVVDEAGGRRHRVELRALDPSDVASVLVPLRCHGCHLSNYCGVPCLHMWCSVRLSGLLAPEGFNFEKVFASCIAPRWTPLSEADALSRFQRQRQQYEVSEASLARRANADDESSERLAVLKPLIQRAVARATAPDPSSAAEYDALVRQLRALEEQAARQQLAVSGAAAHSANNSNSKSKSKSSSSAAAAAVPLMGAPVTTKEAAAERARAAGTFTQRGVKPKSQKTAGMPAVLMPVKPKKAKKSRQDKEQSASGAKRSLTDTV